MALRKVDPGKIGIMDALKERRKVPVWKRAREVLTHGGVEVNIGEINKVTKKGDIAVVLGKVLGDGQIMHSVTLGAFRFTSSAKKKIKGARGKALSLTEFLEKHGDGKKVMIIG